MQLKALTKKLKIQREKKSKNESSNGNFEERSDLRDFKIKIELYNLNKIRDDSKQFKKEIKRKI